MEQEYEELAETLHGRIRATKDEYIICAAIWFDDGIDTYVHQPKNIKTGFVVSGRRHHNCFTTIAMLTGPRKDRKYLKEEQGFLTSKDRFVDRKEAGEIAFKVGQTTDLRTCLFSEDLY